MTQHKSYLHVADILGPHGIKGAVTIFSYTRPAQAVAGYSHWWLGETAEEAEPYAVTRCWAHGRRMLAELEGVEGRDAGERLKGLKVWVPAEAVEIDEDEYLWEELTGCEVVLTDGNVLGVVAGLEEYGAQDILNVATAGDAEVQGVWQLPFVNDIVIDVDLEGRRITVELPEGMDACFTPRF